MYRGSPDNLPRLFPELQLRNRRKINPFGVRRIIIGDGISGTPFCPKVYQRVMKPDPSLIVRDDRIDYFKKLWFPDLDSRFFPHFPCCRLPYRFTGVLGASGEAPLAGSRRVASTDEKDRIFLENNDTDAHERAGWVFA